MRSTSAAGNPSAISCSRLWSSSMYPCRMRSSRGYGGSESSSRWFARSSAEGARARIEAGIGAAARDAGRARGGVAPLAQPVHERLGDVLDDREAAREVAVEGGVPDRHLRLVAGGQHQPPKLVGERHQQVAADARLQVLLGEVGRLPGELLVQRRGVGVHRAPRSAARGCAPRARRPARARRPGSRGTSRGMA